MTSEPVRCLILACGNTLREDDGVGPWLANWAEERFQSQTQVRVVSRHQWTPELAEDIASAEAVVFIDCSADTQPGSVQRVSVAPANDVSRLGTHHLAPPELLALARTYFDAVPRNATVLSVGAGSMELREGFSEAVIAALPEACAVLEAEVLRLLGPSD